MNTSAWYSGCSNPVRMLEFPGLYTNPDSGYMRLGFRIKGVDSVDCRLVAGYENSSAGPIGSWDWGKLSQKWSPADISDVIATQERNSYADLGNMKIGTPRHFPEGLDRKVKPGAASMAFSCREFIIRAITKYIKMANSSSALALPCSRSLGR